MTRYEANADYLLQATKASRAVSWERRRSQYKSVFHINWILHWSVGIQGLRTPETRIYIIHRCKSLPPPTLSSVTCSSEDVYKLLTSLRKKDCHRTRWHLQHCTSQYCLSHLFQALTFLIGHCQVAPSHQNGNPQMPHQCLKVVIIVLTLHKATDPSHCCHCPQNCWNMFITNCWAIS